MAVIAVGVLSAGPQTVAAQGSTSASTEEALAALRRGDADTAAAIATTILERPGSPDLNALWVRANARERLERYSEAVLDFEWLADFESANPSLSVTLGSARFKAGDMDGSIAAFDAAVELDPSLEPRLWQRGISHYYARRLDDCIRQFEVHRTVNPQDVENSVWHFLCVAARDGPDAATAGLIPVELDGRVPMAQVFDLFAGHGTEGQVLQAAKGAAAGRNAQSALFYAHLYLGLYNEALGDAAASSEHIGKAVDLRLPTNYMWHVARVHQLLRDDSN